MGSVLVWVGCDRGGVHWELELVCCGLVVGCNGGLVQWDVLQLEWVGMEWCGLCVVLGGLGNRVLCVGSWSWCGMGWCWAVMGGWCCVGCVANGMVGWWGGACGRNSVAAVVVDCRCRKATLP